MADRPPHANDASTILHRPLPSASKPSSFALVVIDGAERDRVHKVDEQAPGPISIGTSATCELRLSDPSVGRRHASAQLATGGLTLVERDSERGTFVNGVRVAEVDLRGGEILRVGRTHLRVERLESSARATLPPRVRFHHVLGISPEMRRLHGYFERLASSDIPVVIEGETGTGKEVLAASIHEASARRDGPFVVFDCTAVPPALAESALFGHERGAFTGADVARRGVFEQADGGTLLIDEIGDLDLSLQPKLLRAIERRAVQRVGSSTWTQVDVRVLAATRRDLERKIQEQKFRDDLYYRLAVARVELPPLRRRTGDIPFLATYMWNALGDGKTPIAAEFLERLNEYSWPGNLRELRNAVLHRLALQDLAEPDLLRRMERASGSRRDSNDSVAAEGRADAHFLERILAADLPFFTAREQVLAEFTRRFVADALERHGGNVTRAAAASGIARRYFYVLKGSPPSR